uniref:AB hydrolase-1 domain-containing protein n=1 Tax=Zooxanthella nutricula TaxID=1333877 RepID=A0A7S2VQ14_9DINO
MGRTASTVPQLSYAALAATCAAALISAAGAANDAGAGVAADPACPACAAEEASLLQIGSAASARQGTATVVDWVGPCSVGDHVTCRGTGKACSGAQCCPSFNGSGTFPCPSAPADSANLCQAPAKLQNCLFEAVPAPNASWQAANALEAAWDAELVSVQAHNFVRKSVTLANGQVVGYLERSSNCSDGRTLLAFHGLTQVIYDFIEFVAALDAPEDVRVLIPDAMGHGSRIPYALSLGDKLKGWTAKERADDAVAFLDALGDVPGVVDVYGWSMGGATGLSFTAYHPDRVHRAALVAPAAAFTEGVLEQTNEGNLAANFRSVAQAVPWLEAIGMPPAAARQGAPLLAWQRAATLVDPKYWGRMWTGLLSDLGPDAAAMVANCRGKADLVARAGKSVAVIIGTADAIVNAGVPDAIAEALGPEHSQVTMLPGLGHYGDPSDAEVTIPAPAGPVAAKWLGYV